MPMSGFGLTIRQTRALYIILEFFFAFCGKKNYWTIFPYLQMIEYFQYSIVNFPPSADPG